MNRSSELPLYLSPSGVFQTSLWAVSAAPSTWLTSPSWECYAWMPIRSVPKTFLPRLPTVCGTLPSSMCNFPRSLSHQIIWPLPEVFFFSFHLLHLLSLATCCFLHRLPSQDNFGDNVFWNSYKSCCYYSSSISPQKFHSCIIFNPDEKHMDHRELEKGK